MKAKTALYLLIILLAGFALRAFRLDFQSLWYDEILSANAIQAEDTLAAVWGYLHPPLYFLTLRLWASLAGNSEYSLRFLSLFLGTLTLPLLYVLGRQLGRPRVGLMAALLGMASPPLIGYAQEARMYALVTLLSLLSACLLWAALASGQRRLWLAWGLASIAATFSDYSGAVAFAALNAFCLLTLLRRRSAPLLPWLATSGGVALAGLLWIIANSTVGRVRERTAANIFLDEMLRRTGVGFALGPWVKQNEGELIAIAFAALAAAGLVFWLRTPRSALFLLLYLALTVAGVYFLLGASDFAVRYVLVALPPLLLLWGGGLELITRGRTPLMAPAALLLLLPMALSLKSYYFDPPYARDDFRAASRYVQEREEAGDVVVFTAPWGLNAWNYYYQGHLPQVGLPTKTPLNPADTSSHLAEAVSQYQRIWLVTWQDYFSDPESYLKQWLDANLTHQDEASFPKIYVSRYSTHLSPEHAESDFAPLARYLEEKGQAGDVILFNASWGYYRLAYYYRGGLPHDGIETGATKEEIGAQLARLLAVHGRVWLVLWQDYFTDPQGEAKGWLDKNASPLETQSFKGISLFSYRARPSPRVESLK